MHQQGIRTLNKPMPVLGAATILLTIAAAVLGRGDSAGAGLLIGTIICFVAVALITRFLNQPINSIVSTWRADSPPANWMGLRDQWWRGHLIRLVAGLGGLSLLLPRCSAAGEPGSLQLDQKELTVSAHLTGLSVDVPAAAPSPDQPCPGERRSRK
jgi:hypothetical protein